MNHAATAHLAAVTKGTTVNSNVILRLAAVVIPLLMACALQGCGDDGDGMSPVMSYAVSGTVTHLDSGSLIISDGPETLTIPQGATSFSFTKPLAAGTAYAVTVSTQPSGMSCVVSNGSGAIASAAVTNVAIACNTLISQPLAIGVAAPSSAGGAGTKIYLPVTQVGTASTTINAVVDTGSSGVVLDATSIFPASMVSANGFVFPPGQTSLTYDNITVTNVVAYRKYGAESANPTTRTGNLGFAQMTVGTGTHATTAVIPILFLFKISGEDGPQTNLINTIGINSTYSSVLVDGSPASTTLQPCTPQSTTTCGITSPFRYFSYGAGVDKGFTLSEVAFTPCDIGTAGSCPSSPALTLGVNAATISGFTTTGLSSCTSVMFPTLGSEQACSQEIPAFTVASGNASFTGPVIFDSGSGMTLLVVPMGMSFPSSLPAGSSVQLSHPSGFSYQYQTGPAFPTSVQNAASTDSYTNSGIGFFAQNSLLIDYAKAIEGWRNGA